MPLYRSGRAKAPAMVFAESLATCDADSPPMPTSVVVPIAGLFVGSAGGAFSVGGFVLEQVPLVSISLPLIPKLAEFGVPRTGFGPTIVKAPGTGGIIRRAISY